MPLAGDDLFKFHLMEEEQDLDVGEAGDSREGFGGEPALRRNVGFLSAPGIVLGVRTCRANEPDSFDRFGHKTFIFSRRLSKMGPPVRLTDERGRQSEIHAYDELPEDSL